jgi:uncharacterized membrane protein YecN with MAPEG domain
MYVGIVALYAGLCGLIALVLALLVSRQRGRAKVDIGTGGDPGVERAMRAHANFAEYVPLILVLLLILEIDKTKPWVLHILGIALVVGRILHGWGLSTGASSGRAVGIVLTWAVLLVALVIAIVQGIGAVSVELALG